MTVHDRRCKSRPRFETLDAVCSKFVSDARATCPEAVFPPAPWHAVKEEACSAAGPRMREFDEHGVSVQSLQEMGFVADASVVRGDVEYTIVSVDDTKRTVLVKATGKHGALEHVDAAVIVDTFTVQTSDVVKWLRFGDMADIIRTADVSDAILKASAMTALADAYTRSHAKAKVDIQWTGKTSIVAKASVFTASKYSDAAPLTLVPFGYAIGRHANRPPGQIVVLDRTRDAKGIAAFTYVKPPKFTAADNCVVPFWHVKSTPDAMKANVVAATIDVKCKGFGGDNDVLSIPVLRTSGSISSGAELLVHADVVDSFRDCDEDEDVPDDKAKVAGKGNGKGGKQKGKGKVGNAAKRARTS